MDAQYPKSTEWGTFAKETLTDAEPRYVLLDHDYKTTDGRDADKIILISWIPDTAKVMMKMKYAGAGAASFVDARRQGKRGARASPRVEGDAPASTRVEEPAGRFRVVRLRANSAPNAAHPRHEGGRQVGADGHRHQRQRHGPQRVHVGGAQRAVHEDLRRGGFARKARGLVV